MADPPVPARVRVERLPLHARGVIAIVVLTVLYVAVDVALVRPYLWPAGTGAAASFDPTSRRPVIARPPDVRKSLGQPVVINAVVPGSSAAAHGLAQDVEVLEVTTGSGTVDLRPSARQTPEAEIDAWRALYWIGTRGPVSWKVHDKIGDRVVALERTAAWTARADGWARAHLGMMVQIVVFTGGAVVLLLLRSEDLTAGLCVLALALSAPGGGGPLLGAEAALPLGGVLTVYAWLASPLAFPLIALAVLHFPTRAPLIVRHPWIQAIPFAVAVPMVAPALLTALYLIGLDAARGAALWDATHPAVYAASFACALGINLLVIVEGVFRYRFNHDASQRRRIRMAVLTAVPGVTAFAIKDGIPILALFSGMTPPRYPTPLLVVLQALVVLPTFGLVYAVGVYRVLGPRVVLRKSLQYALASRTLAVLGVLPAIALVLSLVRDRSRTLGDIFTSSAGLYVALIAMSGAALRYRERTRQWLDQRFFREEYDARKILVSLATQVRFETDPADLAAMVVGQIDEALHPEMVAILVSGIEPDRLVPVTVRHGSAEPLPLDGGMVGMLRWSDTPLDVVMNDSRSPVRRLPSGEQEWLQTTGAALLVPVVGQDRALIGVIVLGERRSEEAYTDEDRALLGSIAAQMGMGLDVARLRQRAATPPELESQTARLVALVPSPMTECAKYGHCDETGTTVCPIDGSPMAPVPGVPRTVDNKYRMEQLLGRGGMGAVYRARDMRLNRLVALKVVRAEMLNEPDARLRFRREAQIIARLQHPSIVSVYDYGTFADGGAFIVMEMVRGEDLRTLLQREGRMEADRAIRILKSVCEGIDAAHREGVLHRDLKPENILLPADGAGQVTEAKVLDFGVARLMVKETAGAIDDRETTRAMTAPALTTAAGLIVGTPAYMAPEQFNSEPPDVRTDVFSLGVIAYEMLSGELPFGRGPLTEILLAQARGVPPMPRGSAAPEMERAIRTALEMDPDRRPASAQAFAHLVGSALGA